MHQICAILGETRHGDGTQGFYKCFINPLQMFADGAARHLSAFALVGNATGNEERPLIARMTSNAGISPGCRASTYPPLVPCCEISRPFLASFWRILASNSVGIPYVRLFLTGAQRLLCQVLHGDQSVIGLFGEFEHKVYPTIKVGYRMPLLEANVKDSSGREKRLEGRSRATCRNGPCKLDERLRKG